MKIVSYVKKILAVSKRVPNNILYYWNRLLLRRTINGAPAFIVACGHSGTSILLSILSAHPKIYAVPFESYIAVKDDMRQFQKALKQFNRLAIAAGKYRWVEKTPKHILHIGKILKWQPNAKIILILRDGRDVAYSIQQRTKSLEEGISRWCEDNNAARQYWVHPNVKVMKYEDLVSDFETTITDVLAFLGEEYDSKVKDYYKIEKKWYSRKVSKPSTPYGDNHNHNQYRNWQINQPLFDGRKKYKKMSSAELAIVNKFAGSLLVEWGYANPDDV